MQRITVEIDEVSHDGLNKALSAFSELLNRHFVASGNKLQLVDEGEGRYDKYDTLHEGVTYKWVIRAKIEWERIPKT